MPDPLAQLGLAVAGVELDRGVVVRRAIALDDEDLDREIGIDVVMDAVAGKHLDGVVIHQHGKGHDQLALAFAKHAPHVRIQSEHLSRDIELLLGHRPRVRLICRGLGKALHGHRL